MRRCEQFKAREYFDGRVLTVRNRENTDRNAEMRRIYVFYLVDDTDDYCVARRILIHQRQTCGATRRNQNFFADTCTDAAIHCNDEFARQFAVLHKLYFHEFRAFQRLLLLRRYDMTSDDSS